MKKLIISEVISVILTLGIFLLVFSLLNGWEKTGRERHLVAVGAAVFVVFAVAVAGAVADIIAGAAAVFVTFAAGAVAVAAAVFVVFAVGTPGSAAAFAIFVAFFVAFGAALLVGSEKTQKINASKKVIWLSLGVEAVAIILLIILITFC